MEGTIEAPPATTEPSQTATVTPSTEVAAATGQAQVTGTQTPAAEVTPAVEMLEVMGTQIDKSKVTPELLDKVNEWNKSFTEKSQKLSAAEKKASALDQLANNQAFQKWYYEQLHPQTAQPKEDQFALTPEKQGELLSDPQKMRDYIEGLAKSVVSQYALPAAQAAQLEAKTLRTEQEVSRLAEKYPDFDSLNNSGKLEAVVQKYAQKGVDIDLDDAYWLARRDFTESEATLKAHQRVQEKQNGASLTPSGAPAAGTVKIVPGKGLSFEEKMRTAFEASLKGEKIKFDS